MERIDYGFTPSSSKGAETPGGEGGSFSQESLRDLDRDADQFSQMMSDSKTSDEKKQDDKNLPRSSPGDLMLQGLMQKNATVEEQFAQNEKFSKVASEIAERILVTDPSGGGGQEVRIGVKSDLLPGTEIRIRRENGELIIEFVTNSPASAELVRKQQDSLKNLLQSQFPQDTVNVQITETGERDPDGRSQGAYTSDNEDTKV